MNLKNDFSERLAELVETERKESNGRKTLEAVATEIGISKGALSQYIYGTREPKISNLVKIAEHFNVSPNYLLGQVCPDDTDAFLCDIQAYTGLNHYAVKALHEELKDPFILPLLNLIIEDIRNSFFMDNLVTYASSDLWGDLEEDERYNTLPGSAEAEATELGISSADVIRRRSLVGLLDSLSELKKDFHDLVLCHTESNKKKYVTELAMRNIHVSSVEEILYPKEQLLYWKEKGIEIDEPLIEKTEAEIKDSYATLVPGLRDYTGTLPLVYKNLVDYDEFTAVPLEYAPIPEEKAHHRKQALDFLKEYVRRRNSHT